MNPAPFIECTRMRLKAGVFYCACATCTDRRKAAAEELMARVRTARAKAARS